MRAHSFIALAFASLHLPIAQPLGAEDSELDSLDALRWKHRIILVSNPDSCEVEIERLYDADAEVLDRDIFWFAFCADNLTTNFSGALSGTLAQHLQLQYFGNNKTGVVLIGKDGGVKDRSTSLDLIELNQQIDTMPMRRQEVLERTE